MWLIFPSSNSSIRSVAMRGLNRIKSQEKLGKLVLDYSARNDVRLEAAGRISDDRVLADILSVLIDPAYEGRNYDKCRKDIVEKAFPKVSSREAAAVLRGPILRADFIPAELSDSVAEYVRRMGDRDCMERIYRDEVRNAGGNDRKLAHVHGDIQCLRELGASNLEIAKMTPAAVTRNFADELVDDEVIRYFAGDCLWIEKMRNAIPDEKVLSALEGSEHRDEALYGYRIIDGKTYRSPCDFGEHQYEYESEESEPRGDDYNRSITWTYYRCSRCGKERVKVDDGWGRITWHDKA